MDDATKQGLKGNEGVVPEREVRELKDRIKELERVLGRKTMEAEILKDALRIAGERKVSLRAKSSKNAVDMCQSESCALCNSPSVMNDMSNCFQDGELPVENELEPDPLTVNPAPLDDLGDSAWDNCFNPGQDMDEPAACGLLDCGNTGTIGSVLASGQDPTCPCNQRSQTGLPQPNDCAYVNCSGSMASAASSGDVGGVAINASACGCSNGGSGINGGTDVPPPIPTDGGGLMNPGVLF